MSPRIINLTTHPIYVHFGGYFGVHPEFSVIIEPANEPAQVEVIDVPIGQLSLTPGDVLVAPVSQTIFGEVTGLPISVEPDTIYIVSRIVAEALKEKGWDTLQFLVPHDLVHDEHGKVIGCRGFASV